MNDELDKKKELAQQGEQDGEVIVQLTPEEARSLYEQTQDGNSVTLAIQLNETHHYYPDGPRLPVREIQVLDEIDSEVRDRFLDMLERGHDSALEDDKAIREDNKTQRLLEKQGLWGGIGLAGGMGFCGLIALGMGSEMVSSIIFGSTILGILTIVVLKKVWRCREMSEKTESHES